MSYYAEKVIMPKEIGNRDVVLTNIAIRRTNEVLLSGTIYSVQCEPLEGAVVQIVAICGGNRKLIGYVITNEDGEFAIMVQKKNSIKYKLNVYDPLITG